MTRSWALVAVVALTLAGAVEAADAPADLEALWKDACLWEVGSNSEKVPAARQALVARGEPVLDFLIPGKLDTKDTLVTRALTVVVTGVGSAAVPRLVAALESPVANVRRNAADLLGQLEAKESAPAVARLLADVDARMGALSALGAMGATDAVPSIAALLDRDDVPERARVTAAVTLGQIGGADAVIALVRHLSDRGAAIRFACQHALVAAKAGPTLVELLRHPEERVRLHAMAALGELAEPAARPGLLAALSDPSSVVRGFAAEALGAVKRGGDEAALRARLSIEKDPFARGKLEAALAR